MVVIILFTLILSYILISISREDIRTMIISESKLRVFALSGVMYLVYLGSSNENINTIDLILNNSFYMIIIFLIMYLIKSISYLISRISRTAIISSRTIIYDTPFSHCFGYRFFVLIKFALRHSCDLRTSPNLFRTLSYFFTVLNLNHF